MNKVIVALLLLASLNLHGQKIVEGFDIFYKPTKNVPRFRVITEPKDGRWYREVYYVPEEKLFVKAWCKDKECKVEEGSEVIYYSNGNLQSTGSYTNGKKEGKWLQYHENGKIKDSAFYARGLLKGKSVSWDEAGFRIDSILSDGNGNRREMHWYPNGGIASTGNVASDTNKVNRWNYYHENGKILAIENYDSKGKRISCECFTETGTRLDSCVEEEAQFPESERSWFKFLERNLNVDLPVKNGAPVGMYTTLVGFAVDVDGTLSDFIMISKFGFGMEEEVVRMLKTSPPWTPAIQFGRKVKAYRRQPVTFNVIEE